MLYLKRIAAIARYETMMLMRTWKFWILAIIGMTLPIMFNIVIIILKYIGEGPGEFRMQGTLPYIMFYFYNYSLAVIVVFLTSDFREKDKRYRVDSVMYSHCLSNSQLIWGKYLGIVLPLVALNLIVIVLSVLANLLALKSLILLPYISNFMFLTLPGLLFIIPLIIFISSVVRNSAAVFIIIAAYFSLIMYLLATRSYTDNRMYFLLDYGCFLMPLFPSDIIGIAQFESSLLQRFFTIVTGVFFLELSILIFPRKEQARIGKYLTAVVCLGALFVSAVIFNLFRSEEITRREIVKTELASGEQYHSLPGLPVDHYKMDITLFPSLKKISGNCVLSIPFSPDGDSLTFSLNRGLTIQKLQDDEANKIPFSRSGSVVVIIPGKKLQKLNIQYEGTVDRRIEYLRKQDNDPGLIDKYDGPWRKENITSFISSKSTYLLPTSEWYPQSGVRYGHEYPDKQELPFATAEITLRTPESLTPVTQGKVTADDTLDGTRIRTFTVNIPVKKFSFFAGIYNTIKTEIGDFELKYYYFPEHDQNIKFFEESSKEIKQLLQDVFDTIENRTGLKYPYSVLNFVEVPLQFQFYADNSLLSNEVSQPGLVLVREELGSYYFKEDFDREKRRRRRRGDDKSDVKIKKRIFTRFILDRLLSYRMWAEDRFATPLQDYWAHRIDCTGPAYPLFGFYFQQFLREWIRKDIHEKLYSENDEKREFAFEGISRWEAKQYLNLDIDSIYTAIETVSLADLKPERNSYKFHAVYTQKGTKLIYSLEEMLGEKGFRTFLSRAIESYAYEETTVPDLLHIAEEVSHKDLQWIKERWIGGTSLPGYVLLNLSAYKIRSRETKLEYLIDLELENAEKDRGFLKIVLNPYNDPEVHQVQMNGHETIRYRFTTNAYPKRLIIDPIFARNQDRIVKEIKIDKRSIRRSEVKIGVENITAITSLTPEIIVDNVDDGFSIINTETAEYFRPNRNRKSWRTEDWGYGKYKESVRIRRNGSGTNPAVWKCTIPESGYYDLSVYVPVFGRWGWYARWYQKRIAKRFKYVVASNEGDEELTVSFKAMGGGWNTIGRYYYRKGQTAKLMLYDNPDGWVIADAVKWTLKDSDSGGGN